MNNTQSISISQLRQNATEAIETVVKTQSPTIIMQRSKPKAVLVDVSYFQALEDAVLDLTDSREAERAKKEEKRTFSSYINKRFQKS